MIKQARNIRFLAMGVTIAGFLLISGSFSELFAQTRDPFAKPAWARTREPGAPGSVKKSGPPVDMNAPPIESRIEFYKRLREVAAGNGQPIPKVTSVLTLNEMAVVGIFRTPRGYAAMVEATPLKLSYTVYPGEKFFDGQLVAVEENQLIFRRVVKMSNGKFVSSVENKPLKKYTDREHVQGTAPSTTDAAAAQPAAPVPAPVETQVVSPPQHTGPIVSPLDEMNRQGESAEKPKKESKKSVKVAKRQ